MPAVPDGYSSVRTEYLSFGEALFADEEGKDVQLRARDGVAAAHSAVLRAVSKPFRQLLAAETPESQTKSVELPDVTRAELTFFLRLLYTGQIDDEDWRGMPAASSCSYTVTAPEDSEPANAGTLNGVYTPAGTFRGSPKFLNDDQVLLYRGSNEDVGGPYWKLSWKEEEEDEDEEHADPRFEQLWSHADVHEDITDQLIGWDFSQRGGTASAPPLGTWTHDNCVGIWHSPGNRPVTVSLVDRPPLSLLLAALGFAKKYLVEYMVQWLVDATLDRLDVASFEQILGTAIHLDISPLRLRCLRFAERTPYIQTRYNMGDFTTPVVSSELQVLWPRRDTKKRRVF